MYASRSAAKAFDRFRPNETPNPELAAAWEEAYARYLASPFNQLDQLDQTIKQVRVLHSTL